MGEVVGGGGGGIGVGQWEEEKYEFGEIYG